MTVYAITDTKKGRTGIAPTYHQTTHKRGFTYIVTFLIIASVSCLHVTLPESEIDQSSQLILIVKICVYIQDTDIEALQCLHPSLR